jgi:hypothetical protein
MQQGVHGPFLGLVVPFSAASVPLYTLNRTITLATSWLTSPLGPSQFVDRICKARSWAPNSNILHDETVLAHDLKQLLHGIIWRLVCLTVSAP